MKNRFSSLVEHCSPSAVGLALMLPLELLFQLLLQLLPVVVLGLPGLVLQLMLNPLLLLSAPLCQSPLVLVLQSFELKGPSGLVVGETPCPLGMHSDLRTGVNAICDALGLAVFVF